MEDESCFERRLEDLVGLFALKKYIQKNISRSREVERKLGGFTTRPGRD